jgi:hypothetical protein
METYTGYRPIYGLLGLRAVLGLRGGRKIIITILNLI